MRFSIFNALAVAIVAVQAAPAVPPVGITFESGARGAMPLLSLPYATYRATMYDTSDDVSI